jgi:hypothetical protein
MFISQEKLIGQFGLFENLRILVVKDLEKTKYVFEIIRE